MSEEEQGVLELLHLIMEALGTTTIEDSTMTIKLKQTEIQ